MNTSSISNSYRDIESVTLQIDTKHSSTLSLDTTEQPQKYTLEKSGIQLHEKQIVINFVDNAFCTER
ncbi:hypothetical protein P5673_001649 [Acropora cervicornis]|uniref:Uncharacterized protein n=1 Tax=Acropora cervicornis TaxID=6130 RepID=A0AAD9VG38_ACRCE|nr:hypothetical protein P5673_001649 [Acropora cervicornis]